MGFVRTLNCPLVKQSIFDDETIFNALIDHYDIVTKFQFTVLNKHKINIAQKIQR